MPKKKGGKKKAAGAKAGKAKTNPLVAAGVPRFGCAAPQSRKLLHRCSGPSVPPKVPVPTLDPLAAPKELLL